MTAGTFHVHYLRPQSNTTASHLVHNKHVPEGHVTKDGGSAADEFHSGGHLKTRFTCLESDSDADCQQ